MRRVIYALMTTAALALVWYAAPNAQMGNEDRVVPGGGIMAPGWKGKIDKSSAGQGRTINDSKFTFEGGKYTLNIGPAAVYWNPANTASGDYTIKGTFLEPTFQSVMSHPHPYGLFIGGNKMDTDQMSLFYCAPYGNGTFIARGFKPIVATEPAATQGIFRMDGNRPVANDAIHKAEAVGKPVTQDVAIGVKGDSVTCSINGAVVGTYTKTALTAAGLESTDGVYGFRVSHNLDVIVTGFAKQ